MTHTPSSFLRTLCFTLLAAIVLSLPLHATAQEAAPADAPAATATTQAKPAEKPLTDSEKKEAIDAADAITTFDPAKQVGYAKPWQMYYQPASSPVMKQVEPLHDAVLYIITAIVLLVLGLLIYICLKFNKRANPKPQTFTHNKTIEIIWTVVPILILVGIAIPSLRIHYKAYNNETIISNPDLTIKVVGHQWYWSYEYPEQGIAFDSNLTADKDLRQDEPRLLSVDNAVVVPVNKVVRVQLTAADVMHAWALPAFGVKKGAIPGRLNETWFKAEKEGIYYGQCSILCGKQHGFMPIKIIVVNDEQFAAWVKGAKLKFASNDALQFAALTH
ncbi:MAG: cytochrome c oxidase subunit II [Pseudomonadota bacterium]